MSLYPAEAAEPWGRTAAQVATQLEVDVGYWRHARAEQAVAALQRMTAASAGVVRDGRSERVPAAVVSLLVLDKVAKLHFYKNLRNKINNGIAVAAKQLRGTRHRHSAVA